MIWLAIGISVIVVLAVTAILTDARLHERRAASHHYRENHK